MTTNKVYVCDNCRAEHTHKSLVFYCIDCGKEICEDCMYGYATCYECAAGKTIEFLSKRFEESK
jgi:hypothetical protein